MVVCSKQDTLLWAAQLVGFALNIRHSAHEVGSTPLLEIP
jgi:hypothetical protein